MNDVLLYDATNIFYTALSSKFPMERLEIGDYSYVAELLLEDVCHFMIDYCYQSTGETILAFDTGKSWRKSVCNEDGVNCQYKANREKANDKKKAQIELIYGFLTPFIKNLKKYNCFTIINVDESEADDVCYILGKALSGAGKKVTIRSGDIDMALISKFENVTVYRDKKLVSYPLHYKSENVTWESPEQQLMYSIIRGQGKDNVMNCCSTPDDKMAFGPVGVMNVLAAIKDGTFETCKALEKFREKFPNDWKVRFAQNTSIAKKLLDFNCIPDTISSEVIKQYCNSPKQRGIKADFKGLFTEYNLFRLEEKLFIYNNLFGG